MGEASSFNPEVDNANIETELNLPDEWQRQAGRLADLFSDQLEMSRDDYIKGLPQFPEKPKDYDGVLDIPLLVDLRIEQPDLFRKLNLKADSSSIYKVPENSNEWYISNDDPNVPLAKAYSIWINEGVTLRKSNVVGAKESFPPFARGSTLEELLFLAIQRPDLLETPTHFQATGSRSDYPSAVPTIRFSGEPTRATCYLQANEDGGRMGYVSTKFIMTGRQIQTAA